MKYLAGFALPFVILLFLMYFVRGQKPVTYDERQTAVRSTAYKYALITGVLAGFAACRLFHLERCLLRHFRKLEKMGTRHMHPRRHQFLHRNYKDSAGRASGRNPHQ